MTALSRMSEPALEQGSRLRPPYASVLDLIGETPVVELTKFDTGRCRLFVKLESQNPGGSIKDRIALSMIDEAERDGRLKPGGTIVEATAGNTGLGLAQVGIPKGYRIILVVPDKMSREKIQHLRALGAEVRLTRSDVGKGHPEYYQDMAEKIAAEIPGAFYVNQFANPANPLAHETTTGPEIWKQMGEDVDAVVVGVGSGGTLTGLGRFFAKVSPKTEMVLADPVGSVLAPLVKTGEMIEAGSWTVEGIGEDFVPPNADLSLVKKAYSISDKQSMLAVRDLLSKEGILAGSSSGTLLAAALRYCREQTDGRSASSPSSATAATSTCRRSSTTSGWPSRASPSASSTAICATWSPARTARAARSPSGPDDTLLTAYGRMRRGDVSQLPVLEDGKLIGIIDESDILARSKARMTAAGTASTQPVAHGHDRRAAHAAGEPVARRAAADLRPQRGGHRLRRRRIRRPDHPHRPDQPSEARAMNAAHDATASPSRPAPSMAARATIRRPAR